MFPKRPQWLMATACSLLMSAAVATECRYEPERFVTVKDAVVYDRQTDLSWQVCSLGVEWSAASGCNPDDITLLSLVDAQAAIDTATGWRLPTLEELHSIVLRGCEPALDTTVFPGLTDLGDGIPYWTSTRADFPMPMHVFIDFTDGSIDMHSLGFPLAVRLVRQGKLP